MVYENACRTREGSEINGVVAVLITLVYENCEAMTL